MINVFCFPEYFPIRMETKEVQEVILPKVYKSLLIKVNILVLLQGEVYSKTFVKRPLKNRRNKGLNDKW